MKKDCRIIAAVLLAYLLSSSITPRVMLFALGTAASSS